MPHLEAIFLNDNTDMVEAEYCGWGKYYPNENRCNDKYYVDNIRMEKSRNNILVY